MGEEHTTQETGEFAVGDDVDFIPLAAKRYRYRGRRIYATSSGAALDFGMLAYGSDAVYPMMTACGVWSFEGHRVLAESREAAERIFRRLYRRRRKLRDLANHECGAVELARRTREAAGVCPWIY